MAMDNFNSLPKYDIPKNRKKGEDGWKCGRSIYDGEWDMEDLNAVGQVTNTLPVVVSMGDHDDLVSSVD